MAESSGNPIVGFSKGHKVQAAIDNALETARQGGNLPQEWTVSEIKFSDGGVVGPATYVTLETV